MKLLLLAIMLAGCSTGPVLVQPTREPSEGSEDEHNAVREAVKLHDAGRYDDAIHAYSAILQKNPDHVLAMYEMAYSYAGKDDHVRCLEWARKAAEYRSHFLPSVYTMMGNAYDLLGQGDKAIDVYREAIRRIPNDQMLYYNLSVAYFRKKRYADAAAAAKVSVSLRPTHTSSHLVLGQSWYEQGLLIPSFLAMSTFLAYEPQTQRSSTARQYLQEIMGKGVRVEGQKKINVHISETSRTEEGDFRAVELVMTFARALSVGTKLDSIVADSDLIAGELESVFASLGEKSTEPRTGFGWEFYAPFFADMHAKGFTRAYACHMMTSARDERVAEWLETNTVQYSAFLAWMENYRWPAHREP